MAIAFERVPEHMADAGGVRAERRCRPLWKRCGDEAKTFEDARSREILIDVIFEDDVNHREAEGRLRSYGAHAGQALEVDRQRIGDLVFDFLRAVAGPLG